jgi:hypothetical protein
VGRHGRGGFVHGNAVSPCHRRLNARRSRRNVAFRLDAAPVVFPVAGTATRPKWRPRSDRPLPGQTPRRCGGASQAAPSGAMVREILVIECSESAEWENQVVFLPLG